MRSVRVEFLSGGWLRVHGALPGDVYVRTLPDDTGRLRVREVYLDGAEPITADALRDLPLGDIEGMANLEAAHVVSRLAEPGGDRLGVLASHLGTTYGRPGHRLADGQAVERTWTEVAAEDWIVGSWLASLPEDVRIASGLQGMRPPAKVKRRKPRGFADIDYRLTAGPSGSRLDDDFMRRLARAYTAAVARGESPNRTIADDTGYPLRTVQSWVYQARKRGYLPPARKGAAG